QALVQAGVQSAVLGGSFEEYLDDALNAQGASVLGALAFYQVGNLASSLLPRDDAGNLLSNTPSIWSEGGTGRVLLHAVTGGVVAEATGGEFATGAAAAGLQQFLSPALDHLAGTLGTELPGGTATWRAAGAQLTGLVAAGLVDGDLNQGVSIALAADTYNRRLHTMEALILADRIKTDPDNAQRWRAAACALVACSAGVPASDPNYAALVALETEGQLYQAELDYLLATGQFVRSPVEVLADYASAYGQEVALVGAVGDVVLGAGGAILSGLGAAVGCTATLGVACAATATLGAAGVAGGVGMYSDGLDQLNAPFVSDEGAAVLASFDPVTHPGDADPYADFGGFVFDTGVDFVIDKITGHALDRLLGPSTAGVTALDGDDVDLLNTEIPDSSLFSIGDDAGGFGFWLPDDAQPDTILSSMLDDMDNGQSAFEWLGDYSPVSGGVVDGVEAEISFHRNFIGPIPEKGFRADPSTYLSQEYLDDHAALFDGGVVRIQPSAPIGEIGRTETWVLPTSVADNAIAESKGDIARLEQLLGFDAGYLGATPVRVDIPSPTGYRIPTGNEFGANDFWRPGGFTWPGGLPEAVIDPVLPGNYIANPVF
ncbi:MAG: DUF637 domain-containing protein, partial [Nitrospirota bacterium]